MQTAQEQNMNFCSEEIDLLKQEVVQLTSSSLADKLPEMHALACVCVYMRSVMYVRVHRARPLICASCTYRALCSLDRRASAPSHVRSLGRHSIKQ